jgi:hypothetical protein
MLLRYAVGRPRQMMTGGEGPEKSTKFDDVVVEWFQRSLKNLY